MNRRILLLISIASMIVVAGAISLQTTPGYMDADYYFAGATQLAKGNGFVEPYLWNYLDNPQTLPHPSHAYWMPLTSMITALVMKIIGSIKFEQIHWAFVLLVGIIPILTYSIAAHVSGDQRTAYIAGVLAIFPAFYLPFIGSTDTFTIYMILGGGMIVLWLRMGSEKRKPIYALFLFLTGILAGFMHLARADGLMWLFLGIVFITFLELQRLRSPHPRWGALLNVLFVLLGYAVVMGPWFIRNHSAFGAIFPPGGLKTLWLGSYDELFTFPASALNASGWFDAGIGSILNSRIWAIGQGIQTAVAVQGEVILFPLILIGIVKHWDKLAVKIGVLGWGLTFIAMSLIFPFPGARGGFFHSGAALQPFFWAMAGVGFKEFLSWGTRSRGWDVHQARNVLFPGVVVILAALSVIIYIQQVVGADINSPSWNQAAEVYRDVGQALNSIEVAEDEIIVVNNPPGFYLASGRSAIPIPDGGPQTLLAVAQRFDARYLVLDKNHPVGLSDLFVHPDSVDGLTHLVTLDDVHLFEIMVSTP